MTAALALTLAVTVRWMCPADFSPLPAGWIQGNLGPSTVSANSWAHTPGFTNLNDIRPGDTYVWTLLIRREPGSSPPTAREPLRLPLSLNHAEVATQEGSTLPEYRFAGRYRGYFADIRVDFGSKHPHARDLRRANLLLHRLRLPRRVGSSLLACS
jgi:hypothetical protein